MAVGILAIPNLFGIPDRWRSQNHGFFTRSGLCVHSWGITLDFHKKLEWSPPERLGQKESEDQISASLNQNNSSRRHHEALVDCDIHGDCLCTMISPPGAQTSRPSAVGFFRILVSDLRIIRLYDTSRWRIKHNVKCGLETTRGQTEVSTVSIVQRHRRRLFRLTGSYRVQVFLGCAIFFVLICAGAKSVL